jgi:hypothetical protein
MSEQTEEDIGVISLINPDLHPHRYSKQISAFVIISESEISKVIENYSSEWALNNPDDFFKLLWDMGADTRYEIEVQDNYMHRNRLNEVVICRRWACYERTDSEWINSRWASREAKHKASGNKLLRDLNRYNSIPT